MGWFSGSKSKVKQQSLLTPEQQRMHGQLGEASEGAFGSAADYYRNLLSDDSEDFNAFAAPQLRQFNEQIMPDISEQFAGMGSGGMSSSGFRNAAIGAGTDLSERLGAIRANLRMQGAQGLQNIGQQYLNPVTENVMMQGQPGAGHYLMQGIGTGIGQAATAAFSGGAGNIMNSLGGKKVGTNTSPYGANPSASPGGGPQLPNFRFN